jgi:solute carrier family 25 iron transporter 28/37
MAAGALAGISEHGIMFPIDSIKVRRRPRHSHADVSSCAQTRMQVYTNTPAAIYTGMGDAYRRISNLEGHRRLWRGVWSVVLGAGPAHAVYFGARHCAKVGGRR